MVHDHVLVVLAGDEVDAPGVGNVDHFHVAGFRPLGEVKGGVHLDASERHPKGISTSLVGPSEMTSNCMSSIAL